ncbi:hypothetical protein H2203_007224 [Taxawa tesnikishii (nom. ined.)]|nr:hypothetical protein H2203_007224 [Dothideales sp. JES 119]
MAQATSSSFQPLLKKSEGLTLDDDFPCPVEFFGDDIDMDVEQESLSVPVVGKDKQAQKHEPEVSVELDDDPTPSDRMDSVLVELGKPTKRTAGIDLPNLVLNAAQTITETGWWADSIDDQYRKSFTDEVKRFNLNTEQLEFVDDFLTTKVSLSVLCGPPGTGKSLALIAVLYAYVKVNKTNGRRQPILLTAPTHKALEASLKKLIEWVTRFGEDSLEFLLWKGVNRSDASKSRPRNTTETAAEVDVTTDAEAEDKTTTDKTTEEAPVEDVMPGDEGMDDIPLDDSYSHDNNELVEVIDMTRAAFARLHDQSKANNDEFAKYPIGNKRLEHAMRWSNQQGHTHQACSKAYLESLTRYQDQKVKLNQAEVKKLRNDILDMEERLDAAVFADLDIVFSTTSGSAHPAIREIFEPTLIVIDEVALTSLPDAVTPLAVFKESVMHLVVAGDEKRSRNLIGGRRADEIFLEISDSWMDKLTKSDNIIKKGHRVTKLRIQHRMIPEIGDIVSQIFYRGELVHAQSTKEPDPTFNTAQDFFRTTLGTNHYKGWAAFGIEMTGAGIYTETYGKGTSVYNEAEAQLITELIAKMVAWSPPPKGDKIKPSDFLVLTPYTGQAVMLDQKLRRLGLMGGGNQVKLATDAPVLDSDGKVTVRHGVVLRQQKDEPLAIRFAGEAKALNVALTRARKMLIMVGNFFSWVKARHTGHAVFNTNAKLYKFGQLLALLCPRDDPDGSRIISGQAMRMMLDAGTQPTVETFRQKISNLRKTLLPSSLGKHKLLPDDTSEFPKKEVKRDQETQKAQTARRKRQGKRRAGQRTRNYDPAAHAR